MGRGQSRRRVPRLLVWSGAVQSALGFTWVYLVVLLLVAEAAGYLGSDVTLAALRLGYLVVIPGVLISGLVMTIAIWARAYRERSFQSMGTAAYNSFAMAYDTFHVVRDMPSAWKGVGDFFTGDGDSKKAGLVILIVVLALAGGIPTPRPSSGGMLRRNHWLCPGSWLARAPRPGLRPGR